MNASNRTYFLTTLTLLSLAIQASAQSRKPPPPTVGDTYAYNQDADLPRPKPGPANSDDAYESQVGLSDELIAAFQRAYKKLERPRLLVLVGIDARATGLLPRGVQGAVTIGGGHADGAGSILLDFDASGVTEQICNGIESYLNPDGRTKMIDRETLAANAKRLAARLEQAGEDAAVEMLAHEVQADYVFYIKLSPKTAQQLARDPRMKFSGISEIKRIADATKIGLEPFDFDGDLNNERARVYSTALTEVFCKRFIRMSAAGLARDMKLRLIGLADLPQAGELRKLIEKTDGVESRVSRDSFGKNSNDENEAVLSFELGTDPNEFFESLILQARESVGVELTVIDQTSQVMVARVSGGGAVEATGPNKACWYVLTDSKPTPARELLLDKNKKSPVRVAVKINWSLDPNQWTRYRALLGPGVVYYEYDGGTVIEGGLPRDNDLRLGSIGVTPQQLQGEIRNILDDANFEVIDKNFATAAREKATAKAQEVNGDDATSRILKYADDCDLLLWGRARIMTQVDLKNAATCEYVFEMFDVKTGKFIGSVSWDGAETRLSRKDRQGVPARLWKEDLRRGLARYVAGSLMCRFMNQSPVFSVELRNGRSFADVKLLADGLQTHVEAVSIRDVRFDNGRGLFQLSYEGSSDDLKAAIATVGEKIPHARLIEVTGGGVIFDYRSAK